MPVLSPKQPIKVGAFSAAYTLVIALILVLLALYGWWQTGQVSQAQSHDEAQRAQQEAQEAILAVASRMNLIASTLAHWDETQRQLDQPGNYIAWRDHRLPQTNILPGTVDGAALYDSKGRILAPSEGDESMPADLPLKPPGTLFKYERNHSHLYYFFPVFKEASSPRLIGYGGLMFDLVDEMNADRQFRYIDLKTVRIDLPDGSIVDLSQLGNALTYKTLPNHSLDQIQSLYRSSVLQLLAIFLLVLLASIWLMHRYFAQPLRSLTSEIDTLRKGEQNDKEFCSLETLPVAEMESLRRAFYEYHSRLSEMNQNLKRSSQDFYDQARRDPLTGVFNRRAYDEDWRGLSIDQGDRQYSLLLFDCDHFKAINDTYGHHVGDSVIKAIATILHNTLRGEDKLYRLGGDEFATILSDNDTGTAEKVATRCLERVLAHDFNQYGIEEPVRLSIGIAHSQPGVLLSELQKQADIAMYAAKRPTSRKIEVYGEQHKEASSLLANKNVSAIYQTIQDPFLMEMRYQPVVNVSDQQPAYVEALSRIKINGEIITPNHIFPIVQARRLDTEFDLAVIQAVQRDLEFGRVPAHLGVSINVSAIGLLADKVTDMLVLLKQVYPEYKIVVEITETALIDQIDQATKQIHKLRDAGCLVALDDFGSGYSSLRYLASMPVDLVKFDISMMRLFDKGDERQKQVIREIANMVKSAGYQMVAEGIETQEMLEQITALGFHYGQGFLFEPDMAVIK